MAQDEQETKKDIFAYVLALGQRWQYYGDLLLMDSELTTRQWLLLATLENNFTSPPTLKELALSFGSTRQNVKQLLTALERRGFLSVEKDKHDGRTLRIMTTAENARFWADRSGEDMEIIEGLLERVEEDKLVEFRETLQLLYRSVEEKIIEEKES